MKGKIDKPEWDAAYKDSRWQKKRLEIMERDGWECQSCCGSVGSDTLNVHHRYYEQGKKPWEYADSSLVTLCEDCHKAVTEARQTILKSFGELTCTAEVAFYSDLFTFMVQNQNLRGCWMSFADDQITMPLLVELMATLFKSHGDAAYGGWKSHKAQAEKVKP